MPTKNTLRILVALQIAAVWALSLPRTCRFPALVRNYHLPTYIYSSAPETLWLANLLTLALLVVLSVCVSLPMSFAPLRCPDRRPAAPVCAAAHR